MSVWLSRRCGLLGGNRARRVRREDLAVPYQRYLEASLVCPYLSMHARKMCAQSPDMSQALVRLQFKVRCLDSNLTAWRSPLRLHSTRLLALIDRWCVAVVNISVQQLSVVRRRCGVGSCSDLRYKQSRSSTVAPSSRLRRLRAMTQQTSRGPTSFHRLTSTTSQRRDINYHRYECVGRL